MRYVKIALIASAVVSAPVWADPDKNESGHYRADGPAWIHSLETEREARKYYEELEREEGKHREEMRREWIKHYEEMHREARKRVREIERERFRDDRGFYGDPYIL